jgi:predicted TIM-barrel fold metal-dependent hydrolase
MRTMPTNPAIKQFSAPIEELIVTMDAAGVGQAVLIQPSLYGSDHSYLTSCLEAYPQRTVGMALASPADPSFNDWLQDVASGQRITGIRIAPMVFPEHDLSSIGLEPTVRIAAAHQMSLNLLVTPLELSEARGFIVSHPDLVFVIDHLSHPDLSQTASTGALRPLLLLADSPNVRVKLSALPELSTEKFPHADVWAWARQVLSEFGPERCMWGSDFPFVRDVSAYRESVELIDLIFPDISSRAKGSILADTARETYRLPNAEIVK